MTMLRQQVLSLMTHMKIFRPVEVQTIRKRNIFSLRKRVSWVVRLELRDSLLAYLK